MTILSQFDLSQEEIEDVNRVADALIELGRDSQLAIAAFHIKSMEESSSTMGQSSCNGNFASISMTTTGGPLILLASLIDVVSKMVHGASDTMSEEELAVIATFIMSRITGDSEIADLLAGL